MTRMTAAVLSVWLGISLVGCTGTEPPEPTPTPAFASEAEAFAAAEETYRAYVDALNAVDLSDPTTFEAVYAWTTGEANAKARKSFTQMHADRWVVGGTSEVTAIVPRLAGGRDAATIELAVCLDVSGVTLVDDQGASVVSADRPNVQPMMVTLTAEPSTRSGLGISEISGRDGEPTCT